MFQKRNLNILLLCVIAIASCGKNYTDVEYFELAKEKFGEKKYEESIALYEELIEKYPESEKKADSLFFIGYVYANHLNDFKKAKEYYGKMIAEFPNNDLATSAQFEIEMLGKNADDLEKVIQERIADQAKEEKGKK